MRPVYKLLAFVLQKNIMVSFEIIFINLYNARFLSDFIEYIFQLGYHLTLNSKTHLLVSKNCDRF